MKHILETIDERLGNVVTSVFSSFQRRGRLAKTVADLPSRDATKGP